MPDIDVTDILFDTDVAEQLSITRREQVISTGGVVSTEPTTISPRPWGVVIPQADLATQRGPDQATLPRLLQVHTTFRLRGASNSSGASYLPDILTWNGDSYVVNKVQDYSHFGPGFIQADCSAQGAVQQAPV